MTPNSDHILDIFSAAKSILQKINLRVKRPLSDKD